jgi:PEGA domain
MCGFTATAAWTFHRTGSDAPSVGFVRVVSEPAGALVQVDGTARGVTPVRIPLPPGRHDVVVASGSRRTTLIADVTGGRDAVHQVVWVPDAPTPPRCTGPRSGGPGARPRQQ